MRDIEYNNRVMPLVHRSIAIKNMKLKPSRNFDSIKKQIETTFGPVFEVRAEEGYVIVTGDLHDYRTREKLFEIITSKKVGG